MVRNLVATGRAALAVTAVTALAAGAMLAVPTAASAVDVGSPVVVNEVYGGGGNSGAQYKSDFIELFNSGTAAVDLGSYSVQYSSATGTSWTNKTDLTGSIPAGGYYLVAESAGNGGSVDLPAPDVTGDIGISGTAGKVALVNTQTALTCATHCASATGVVDFVGYGTTANDFAGTGPAPAPSNTNSDSRSAAHANTGNNSADFSTGTPSPTPGGGTTTPPGNPVPATIEQVQGTGSTSPLNGKTVITKGVVTAAYPTGGYNGYTIQTPGTGGAIDFSSHTGSDGVFVYSPTTVGNVAIGDYVQLTGAVSEYNGLTEINVSAAADLTKLTDTVTAPTAATTTSFPAADAQRESLESMLYKPTGDYTITNTYGTNQYGELGLAAGTTPLIQWTEVARPNTDAANAVKADNDARAVVLDDGETTNFLSTANSGLTPPYISLTNPIRVGAPVAFSKPVIFSVGGSPTAPSWRFQPTGPVSAADPAAYPASWQNTRAATPSAANISKKGTPDFKVASFNVENFFTTFGDTRPDCSSYKDRDGNPITVNRCTGANGPRGAWNAASFSRQQDKIVSAINSSGTEVAGLMEIENSVVLGAAKDSTLAELVDALNAKAGAGTWAYIPSSTELPAVSAMDVINSAIIYQPAVVAPVGASRALGTQSGAGQAFDQAREPIAQKFVPVAGGAEFLFVVNHFKSKGSSAGGPGDADTGDGQGASNGTRVREATALRDWIPTLVDPAKEAIFMVGDYNAYSQEDPLQVLYGAGYVDAEHAFDVGKYSYSYSGLSGSLDHAMMNSVALARSTGADIWNINSAESVALDYSRYNYHGTLFYAPDPFASSDHDPVVIGVRDNLPAVASAVTLTASAAGQTFGTGTPATITATVTMADGSAANGTVAFRADDGTLLGTATVSKGKATVQVRRLLGVGRKHITGQFMPADKTTQAGSTSAPLTFQVYMALSSTKISAKVVTVKGDPKHKYGLVISGTVTIGAPSTLVGDGTLNVNVNGVKAATARVRSGTAITPVIPVSKGTATVIATFIPTDATDVQRSTAPFLTVKINKQNGSAAKPRPVPAGSGLRAVLQWTCPCCQPRLQSSRVANVSMGRLGPLSIETSASVWSDEVGPTVCHLIPSPRRSVSWPLRTVTFLPKTFLPNPPSQLMLLRPKPGLPPVGI
ncbi:MAG: ExeM/NucH family extracellular endonuclease [Nakamurella sp.]